MDKEVRFFFLIRRNWAWFFCMFLFFAAYIFICQDMETTLSKFFPKENITMWHGMFFYLSNGLLMPVQYWLGLLLLCYQVAKEQTVNEVILRYQSKRRWLRNLRIKSLVHGCSVALISFLLLGIINTIRYGFPKSFAWESIAMCSQPIPVILITSLLSHILITCFAIILYLTILLYCKNCTISFLIAAVILISANLVLILTPQYMSFKLFFFSSCISYAFFLSDGYLLNIVIATVTPVCTGGILLFLQENALRKFPEKG